MKTELSGGRSGFRQLLLWVFAHCGRWPTLSGLFDLHVNLRKLFGWVA